MQRRKLSREFKLEAVRLQVAFPGHGNIKPEQQEIARLRKEVAKLKAERDILKRPQPSSRAKRYEVRFRRGTGTSGRWHGCARRSISPAQGSMLGSTAAPARASGTTRCW